MTIQDIIRQIDEQAVVTLTMAASIGREFPYAAADAAAISARLTAISNNLRELSANQSSTINPPSDSRSMSFPLPDRSFFIP